MPPIIIEVHEDGSPYLELWEGVDPDFPIRSREALERAMHVPERPRSVIRRIHRGRPGEAAAAEPAAREARPQPAARSKSIRLPRYQELNLLIAECDYRGEQLTGSAVGGCGCSATWHCTAGKGLPMTPYEVPKSECLRCVSGQEEQ